jgi:hypothetical protein
MLVDGNTASLQGFGRNLKFQHETRLDNISYQYEVCRWC